jgi:hypothetical protein
MQDQSGLDFSQFKPARFEFEKKDGQINMRVPKPFLAEVKLAQRHAAFPIRASFGRLSNGQSPHERSPLGHGRKWR